jgi:hypothetical protein
MPGIRAIEYAISVILRIVSHASVRAVVSDVGTYAEGQLL